ncbi:APC family permease [Mollicutes bacterium LVI A0039]|nr:APC family permease [Mollicutes bacterium LVI A0039]
MEKQSYNFATAISMVVGVVIGSGIFFKADDILIAVNGNVMLGVIGFLVVGLGVLFGALAISYYSFKDKEHTGIIGYSRMALGSKFAFVVGWFTMLGYFPTFVVVLATVGAIYMSVLLNIDSKLFISIATAILLASSLIINYKYPKVGGKLQVVFTVAKIIPLIIIGLIGTLFFTDAASIETVATNTLTGGKPFSALIAIAFAFDGWIVTTNISSELQDSEKNLPRALALGSVAIVAIYCLYFFGVTQIVGPEEIVRLGDGYTEVAAQAVLGPIGGKIITMFVIISVYGGLNGMTLAFLRIPRTMIETGLMKNIYGNDQEKSSHNMFLLCTAAIVFYFIFQQLLNYELIFTKLSVPFDLSNLPIIINYIFYIVLFIIVNRVTKQETTAKRLYYLFISLIATITAVVIIMGTVQVNGLLYILCSVILAICGIPFYKRQTAQ